MTPAETKFEDLATSIERAVKGKIFGALCLKVANNGKAFVMLWKGYMIFKLTGDDLQNALSLDGAKIFEPADGRQMGGWVQLEDAYIEMWGDWARKAFEYVRTIVK